MFALNELFGLAPGLSPLRELWQANEIVALHAMAIPFRTRSHFDGQAILETGIDRPIGSSDGWLNRLLQVMSGSAGIAIAAGMPRSLTGSYEVQTWSPTQLGVVDDAYLQRLRRVVSTDKALYGRFEAAVQQQDTVGEEPMARGNARRGGWRQSCRPRPGFFARTMVRTSRRWSSAAGIRTPIKASPAARSIGCLRSWLKG